MAENTFKFVLIDYWRSIDKKFYFVFNIFLGLFFHFHLLAGERLNKDITFLQNIYSLHLALEL